MWRVLRRTELGACLEVYMDFVGFGVPSRQMRDDNSTSRERALRTQCERNGG